MVDQGRNALHMARLLVPGEALGVFIILVNNYQVAFSQISFVSHVINILRFNMNAPMRLCENHRLLKRYTGFIDWCRVKKLRMNSFLFVLAAIFIYVFEIITSNMTKVVENPSLRYYPPPIKLLMVIKNLISGYRRNGPERYPAPFVQGQKLTMSCFFQLCPPRNLDQLGYRWLE